MKILFSDNTLSGLLNFRSKIIEQFLAQGHEVVLVAPNDRLSAGLEIPSGVRFIEIRLSRTGTDPISDLRYYRALKKIYRAERPDYIFHYTIKPNIYGSTAAHRLGIRSSAIIAGLGHVYTKNSLGNRIARAMYRMAMRYPEKVLALNHSNYDTLLRRKVVKADKLILLEGGEGVDLRKFAQAPMPANKKPVFLMICRLLYEKGYAEYVAAAETLQGQAEFRIMGSIDTHPAAVPSAVLGADVARGAIRYIAHSPHVQQQIAEADCIVLPSYGEGLSRVLMEGLAIGRPLIASDIAGCRETVDDGMNGYCVAPRNAESLTVACRKFLALTPAEKKAMGEASRRKAERQFDIEKACEVYQRILNHSAE